MKLSLKSLASLVRAGLTASGAFCIAGSSIGAPGETIPISVGLPGSGPIAASGLSSVSSNGRFVAFSSSAPDLVLGDTNGVADVFVADRQTGQISRVSISSTGNQANQPCGLPGISDDGQTIVFSSASTNLTAGGTNELNKVFVHNRTNGTTSLLSLDSSGALANNHCFQPSISGDGRFVAFTSGATNLVFADANLADDIFLRDLQTNTTTRVSISTAGGHGGSDSSNGVLSRDGRFVAFQSLAINLVPDDTNMRSDVFVRDRTLGVTTRISVSASGVEGNGSSSLPSISSNGQQIAFESDATNLIAGDTNAAADIFVRNTNLGLITRASVSSSGAEANGQCLYPSLSGDGNSVAFYSLASNLVASDTNAFADVFVRHLETGTTARASTSVGNGSANHHSLQPCMSADGQSVTFHSNASNLSSTDTNSLQDVFIYSGIGGVQRVSTHVLDAMGNGSSFFPSVTADGRYVAFVSEATTLAPGDTNQVHDIFVRDVVLGTTSRVNISTAGIQANAVSDDVLIAANGRYVVFQSGATNLVPGDTNANYDVFLRDMSLGTTTRLSVSNSGVQANDGAYITSISANGRFVLFTSFASNLVPGDTNGRQDMFLRDNSLNLVSRVSIDSLGNQVNGDSYYGDISNDGRYVAFSSVATNLVPQDTNNTDDVFVHDRTLGTTTRVSVGINGVQGNSYAYLPSISADGRYVGFCSRATNLIDNDTNGWTDAFVLDRQTSSLRNASVNSSGEQANRETEMGRISKNGRFVLFRSLSNNLVSGTAVGHNFFCHDLQTGSTVLANKSSTDAPANRGASTASISADGQFIAFSSSATNLTNRPVLTSNQDVYRREMAMPLSLSLTFADWLGTRPPLTASYVLRTSGGTTVGSGSLEIGSTGKIYIGRPAGGFYSLVVKAGTFLARRISIFVSPSSGNLGTIALTNGDVDGNNIIDISDYSLLSSAFGATPAAANWSANADLNGDLFVDVADYTILARNFDLFGDE